MRRGEESGIPCSVDRRDSKGMIFLEGVSCLVFGEWALRVSYKFE